MPDRYDPLMMLNDATDKGSPPALQTPSDHENRLAGLDRFNGAANLGTTTTEKMPLMTYGTPADNGLRLPEGAQNFNSLGFTPAPVPPYRQAPSYDHGLKGADQ